jgi:hypothetical protein
LPAEHTSPAAHAVPHAPQLARSVSTVTQVPLHSVCEAGHDTLHLPATHTRPESHALPQAPQLLRSESVSTHLPSHCVCEEGHGDEVSVDESTEASSALGDSVSSPELLHAVTAKETNNPQSKVRDIRPPVSLLGLNQA